VREQLHEPGHDVRKKMLRDRKDAKDNHRARPLLPERSEELLRPV
jgi:hypothetical protein